MHKQQINVADNIQFNAIWCLCWRNGDNDADGVGGGGGTCLAVTANRRR